jgi:hypothetical protein
MTTIGPRVYRWFGIRDGFDPDRFAKSPVMAPVVLGVFRLIFAIYMTACIIAEPLLLRQSRRTRREAKKFLGYFTNITFVSFAWCVFCSIRS